MARRLSRAYPQARVSLDFGDPLELLVATILSAQCTDARVNIVTKKLFAKYLTAGDYARVPRKELEKDIRSTGFYRNKAKNIQGACRMMLERFDGKVPKTTEEILELPGVGRKTAAVVLGNAYGIQDGIPVDTHCFRLAHRLGFSKHKDPDKVERDLLKIVPQKQRLHFSNLLIFHGRAVCQARKPHCTACVLSDVCPSFMKEKGNW